MDGPYQSQLSLCRWPATSLSPACSCCSILSFLHICEESIELIALIIFSRASRFAVPAIVPLGLANDAFWGSVVVLLVSAVLAPLVISDSEWALDGSRCVTFTSEPSGDCAIREGSAVAGLPPLHEEPLVISSPVFVHFVLEAPLLAALVPGSIVFLASATLAIVAVVIRGLAAPFWLVFFSFAASVFLGGVWLLIFIENLSGTVTCPRQGISTPACLLVRGTAGSEGALDPLSVFFRGIGCLIATLSVFVFLSAASSLACCENSK